MICVKYEFTKWLSGWLTRLLLTVCKLAYRYMRNFTGEVHATWCIYRGILSRYRPSLCVDSVRIYVMLRSIYLICLFLFIGVVGPEFSSEAEAISPILSSVHKERRLVQVGFSTTAARLGDNQKYPNFVRVVPNDNVQVEVCHFNLIIYHNVNSVFLQLF